MAECAIVDKRKFELSNGDDDYQFSSSSLNVGRVTAPVIFAGTPSTADTQIRSPFALRFKDCERFSENAHQDKMTYTRTSTQSCLNLFANHDIETTEILTRQVEELSAALSHSKANEKLLNDALAHVKAVSLEREQDLIQKQELLNVIEQEHRKVKATLRDVLNAASESDSAGNCKFMESDNEEKFSLGLEKTDINGNAILIPEDSETLKQAPQNDYHDLLLSFKRTSKYAEKLSQRNSFLEIKCSQLEMDRDSRLRELHEELGHARRLRQESDSRLACASQEMDELKEQTMTLHNELRELHERLKLTKTLETEVDNLSKAQESLQLANVKLESNNKKLLAELQSQKEHSILEAKRQSEVLRSVRASESTSTSAINQYVELKESLESERMEFSTKLKEMNENLAQLQRENSTLAIKLGETVKQLAEENDQVESLSATNESLLLHCKSMGDELEQKQGELTTLRGQLSEFSELKEALELKTNSHELHEAQFQEYMELIRQSNEKFSNLSERYKDLESKLESQDAEKESFFLEASKASEELLQKLNMYKSKWEQSKEEVYLLKKQIVDLLEEKENSIRNIELNHLTSTRELEERYTRENTAIIKKYESDIFSLLSKHEFDMCEVRREREERSGEVVAQYEDKISRINEENRMELVNTTRARDEEAIRMKNQHESAMNELRDAYEEQLTKFQDEQDEKFANIAAIYESNIQSHLQKKKEEITEKQREIELLQDELERQKLLSVQKMGILQEQLATYKSQIDAQLESHTSIARMSGFNEEAKELREEIDKLVSESKSKIKTLQADNKDIVESLNRKLEYLEQVVSDLKKDNRDLENSLKEKQLELQSVQSAHFEEIERLRHERDEFAASFKRLSVSRNDKFKDDIKIESKSETSTQKEDEFVKEISKLEQKIENLREVNHHLQRQLDQQQILFGKEPEDKDQRLSFLALTKEHYTEVLNRNTELEKKLLQVERQTQEIISEKLKYAKTLETANEELSQNLTSFISAHTGLQDRYMLLENTCSSLKDQLKIYEKEFEKFQALISKVAELTNEVTEIKFLLDQTESLNSDASNDQTMKKDTTIHMLTEQLLALKSETSRIHLNLSKSLENPEENWESSSRIASLTIDVQTQRQIIDQMESALQIKQRTIEDLKHRVDELEKTCQNEVDFSVQGFASKNFQDASERIDRISQQCAELMQQRIDYEQEKRVLLHRMEIEKQILSQCLEQKNCQLKHLLEINKRAEQLLHRNAELENALLNANTQLDKMNAEQGQVSNPTKEHQDLLNHEHESQNARELEFLREILKRNETEAKQLKIQMKQMQLEHMQQLNDLQSRARQDTYQSALDLESAEMDLLKVLVDKTAELQREVALLRQERELNNTCKVVDCKSHLRTSTADDRTKLLSDSSKSTNGLSSETDILTLKVQINQLINEKANLVQRIEDLASALNDSEKNAIYITQLQRNNDALKNTVRQLSSNLEKSKSTIYKILDYANSGVEQYASIDFLMEQFESVIDRTSIIENLQERNIKVKLMLESLKELITLQVAETSPYKPTRRWNSVLHFSEKTQNDDESGLINCDEVVYQTNVRKSNLTDNRQNQHLDSASTTGHATPKAKSLVHEMSPITERSMFICASDAPTGVPEDDIIYSFDTQSREKSASDADASLTFYDDSGDLKGRSKRRREK